MYAVVRTDRMSGTDNRADLISLRYQPSESPKEIENGCVVKAVELEPGQREVYKAVDPIATDKLEDIYLVASPEVVKADNHANLDEFINKAGVVARGYRMNHSGQMFSVTKEALTGVEEPEVGNFVELAAANKMNVVAHPTGEEATLVGKIMAVETAGRYTYYVIQVA